MTRQPERPQVMPVATLGRPPWAVEAAHRVGLGHRDVKVAAAPSQGGRRPSRLLPNPELVTACVGISVGNLDTSKEVG